MEEDVVVAKHDRPDEEPAHGSCSPSAEEKTVQQPLVKRSRRGRLPTALLSMRGRA
jgi:hypothetical protein